MKKLPRDVAINILLKLPVKSLMRIKCLSKSCYSLVQSSTFINLHLNRAITYKDDLILFKCSFQQDNHLHKTILSFFSGDDDNYLQPINPDLDVPCMTSKYSIIYDQFIGPCHGIVALMNNVTTVLINPSKRNYRQLPPSPLVLPPGFDSSVDCVGFGFDTIANDYKVIRILEVYQVDDGYPIHIGKKFEVYDLVIDSWRELDPVDQKFPTLYWSPGSQMFYKGACHWIAITTDDPMVILSFDLSTETFRTTKMPDSCSFINGPKCGLAVLNDTLTVIAYPNKQLTNDKSNEFTYVWLLKDYDGCVSWIKKYTIKGLPIESPLAVWRECLMLFQCSDGFLMSYNLCSNEVKKFNLRGAPVSLRVVTYHESLTPVPKGNQNSTQVQSF